MQLDFKKEYQVFLLDPSFDNTEFYYFSVDQSWYNGIKMNNCCIITVIKDGSQFSQSIARPKIKKIITVTNHNGDMINLTM